MSLLAVDGLTVTFPTPTGPLAAVDGVSLALEPGEIVGLVGESGSGKSVLGMAIMRLLPGNARIGGRIALERRDLLALPESAMRTLRGGRIGLIPQNPAASLNPVLTIERQLDEVIAEHGRDRCEARALLAAVGLPAPGKRRRYPFELSGGMKQRALAAIGIAGRPALLIADEPTKGLDAPLRAQIVATLRAARAMAGAAMIVITHDLDVAFSLCDRLLVMRHGRIVEEGPSRRLATAPRHAYTRQLIAAQPSAMPIMPETVDRPPLLTATGLTKRFGRRRLRGAPVAAVDDASLSIAPGETLGLTGPSGCGKSTLARLLAGLISADRGSVDLAGPSNGRDVQMLFQHPEAAFDPRWRLGASLLEPWRMHRLGGEAAGRKTVTALLGGLGLDERLLKRFPHQVSGGQLQRLALARALSLSPRVIVLDEPTSMLDVLVQAQVMDALRAAQTETGLAYLFITHDLDLAAAYSHRLAIMHDGRIAESGLASDVRLNPSSDTGRRLRTAFRAGRADAA